ncbi:MAG: biotin synthase BioB [Candidatus Omnitrophota bacterium]
MLDLILEARRKVLNGGAISREEALALSDMPQVFIPYLAAAANEVRQTFAGNAIESCALSNIKSGNCSEDCKFCSQSAHYKTESPVYPQITVEEILSQARAAEAMGATEFCMVSSGWGATNEREFQVVLEAVRRISDETKLFVDCSLGFLTGGQMRQLKEAGLYRNNHNLEASKNYFDKICTTHTYRERVSHVEMVRHFGIHPCSGGILGMGETPADRIDLAFELKRLDAHCVPINILNPRPGTPLENVETLGPLEIIKTIAIYRLILPKSTIKIAGGREVNLRDLQALAMQAGANGLILGNYLTTMGRNPAQDLQMMKDLGFETAQNGHGCAQARP